MNFEQAGQQYVVLRQRLDNKLISQEEYVRLVGQLVVTSPDGRAWALEPFAGTWVELARGGKPAAPVKPKTAEPQSLLQLAVFLAKGMIKGLPRMILGGLLMAVLTWVAHTYIIAAVNDGLMYEAANVAVNSVVHLQQTHFPGVDLFWGLLSYFLTSFFMRALSQGPKDWLKSILRLPVNIWQAVKQGKSRAQVFVLVGVSAAWLVMLFYRNFMLSWVLAIGALLILTAGFASVEALTLKTALLDLQRLIKRRIVGEGEEYSSVCLLILGMCGGFSLAGIWGARVIFSIIGLLLVVAYFVFRIYHQRQKARVALMLLIMGSGFLLYEMTVLAWCEGASLSRAGGNWLTWWGSDNADLVRRLGLMPAGFSFAGGILGAAVASLTPLVSSTLPSLGAAVPVQGAVEGGGYGPAAAAPSQPDGSVGGGGKSGAGGDLVDQAADLLEGHADTAEWLKGVITNAMDFTEQGIIPLINKYRQSVFEALNMKDPLEYSYWTARGVNVSRAKTSDFFGKIGDGLWWFDVLNDTLINIEKGDSYIDSSLKSLGSNYMVSLIPKIAVGPKVILYEVANSLLLGGSEAGEIASHVNTLKEGTNFLYDKVKDVVYGTDEARKRLDSGHYGRNLQNLHHGTEILAEWSANEGQMAQDISDVVTDDDFYKNMRETNREIWKPAEDSWRLTRGVLWVGEKAFEDWIHIAEATKDTAQYLGEQSTGWF